VLPPFALALSGTATIDTVTDQPPGDDSCAPEDFLGSVAGLPALLAPDDPLSPFEVFIATKSTAPDACQGDDVDYSVVITGMTP
jgi:hypothetical protein